MTDERIEFVVKHSKIVMPVEVSLNACRDMDDLAVIGTALAAMADCIVTGDNDLLVLNAYAGIPIVSPRQLYNTLGLT